MTKNKFEMQVLTCSKCGHAFQALAARPKSKHNCPECRHQYCIDKMRENRAKKRGFLYPTFATIQVVKHEDEYGFRPGAEFNGNEMALMVRDGCLEGAVVRAKSGKNAGAVYRVVNNRMVEAI